MTGDALVPLMLSLKVAGLATLANVVLGVGLARFFSRRSFPGRTFADALLTLPMVMPPTVLGYYLLVLIGTRGALGGWLWKTFGIRLVFTWQAAVIAAAVMSFPLVFKAARAAFESADRAPEDVARTLGLGETSVFFRVALPAASRGILAGTLLAFARSLGEFGATLMVAGSIPGKTATLSLAVYDAVQAGDDDTALFLTAVASVAGLCVLMAGERLAGRRPGKVMRA